MKPFLFFWQKIALLSHVFFYTIFQVFCVVYFTFGKIFWATFSDISLWSIQTPMKYQVTFHAKTCYLHMWKYHRCYGYIINRAFHTKKLLKEMVWYFIGVYVINRTLHGRLEIRNFSSSVEKYFTSRERSERVKYFFNTIREISYLQAAM